LLVHGILHLMGMDHAEEAEAGVMERKEQELLDRFYRSPPPSGGTDGAKEDRAAS
jgi:probable rRNA maturation factor